MSISTQQHLPFPATDVFDWFSRPGAFERLAPPWQPVHILSEAASLRDGEAVLRMPLGLRWVARHRPEGFRAGERFEDRPAAAGPRSWPLSLLPWEHIHEVMDDGAGGCVVSDRVTTPIPAVALRDMFDYRHRQLDDDLRAHARARRAGWESRTIAVTGASGLVGTALSAFLSTGGHRVLRLVRRQATRPDEIEWDPHQPDPRTLEGVEAVVHLAGEGIAGRFTHEHVRRVRESRVEPTRALARAAERAGVSTFVCASAIGFYGADRGDELLAEDATSPSAPRELLAGIVREWEAAAANAGGQMRVVNVRTGLVQSAAGGGLALIRRLGTLGLAGPLGPGTQWQSWISADDLVEVYHRALWDESLVGPVNAVAPHPVRQRDYARTLASVLHRPGVFPTPAWGPEIIFGSDGARELVLASQRVDDAALRARAHEFRFTDLESALRHTLGRARPAPGNPSPPGR
ncbi:TIGR01777 family protein [Galactobacter valiniphilus]|uniref:TIGR01777 family protein n=1 Tax=Galactobacter valiniphilus TaxID=2676122 RepID=A0A399J6K8_9MICC|nr:TIGR01777 family oxidoreductase [Galactobacter valiniphilus]RII41098.1 TIGR01777 family protein [Galactobacter valiniphilus]